MRSCPPTRLLLAILIVVTISWLATLVFLVGNCSVGGDAASELHYDAGAHNDRQVPHSEHRSAAGAQPVAATRLYVITPTYARLVQKAELTRLSHTFCLAAVHGFDVHWIIVEDAAFRSALVASLLAEACRLPSSKPLVPPVSPVLDGRTPGRTLRYTHLHEPTPEAAKLRPADPSWLLPRGVLQRNAALRWLRSTHVDHADVPRAVVYFADDDNTYDIKLFYEMVLTQKVSVWPVGVVGYLKYEAPIVENGKVVSWYTYWHRQRRYFAMDMAGFAVSLSLIISNPEAAFSLEVERGFQESALLSKLGITLDDLEPRAENCTQVFVWHTRSEVPSLKNERKMLLKYNETYPVQGVVV